MGNIGSCVSEIRDISWDKLKTGQIYKNCEVVVLDSDNVAIVKTDKGRYSVIGRNENFLRKVLLLDYINDSLFKAMITIGLTTQEDVDRHKENITTRRKMRLVNSDIDSIRRACERQGWPVPDYAKEVGEVN